MKASRFALPLVMALALTAGSATVFAASPNSDQPHAGMPMNGSSNMPMNGMMGGYGESDCCLPKISFQRES